MAIKRKWSLPVTAVEVVKHHTAKLAGRGASKVFIKGFATLADAGPMDLSFYTGAADQRNALMHTHAGLVALTATHATLRAKPCVIVTGDPRTWFAAVLADYGVSRELPPGVHETATVDASARLGRGVHVGAGAIVAADVTIGAHTRVLARAVITARCSVGADCVLHEGCVIGADGFGLYVVESMPTRMKHLGVVRLSDHVEIGANSCVDRGTLGDTVIGAGTKVDNLVQIAHNVTIGENCVVCGQCAIGGSVVIEDGCMLGGMVGVVDHVRLAAGVRVLAGTMVVSNLREAGVTYGGPLPVMKYERMRRLWRGLLGMAKK